MSTVIDLIRRQKETLRRLQAQLTSLTDQETKLKKKPVRTEYDSRQQEKKEKELKQAKTDLQAKIRHAESELLSLEKQRQLPLF